MTIKLINRGAEGELIMDGRLDALSAPEVEQVFTQVSERFDKVVLNMDKLTYISSLGLRALKLLYMQQTKKGGELELKNVNKMIMEVFEMTGFAGLLKFV